MREYEQVAWSRLRVSWKTRPMIIFAATLLSLIATITCDWLLHQHRTMIGCADMWHHILWYKPITHLQPWKLRWRLKALVTYYLILLVISKVLHKKLSYRVLCLLFRTLYIQNILVFVHSKATSCFGCKSITMTYITLELCNTCVLIPSPRFSQSHLAQW